MIIMVVEVGGSVVSKAQYYYITTGLYLYLCVLYRSPHNCNFKFSPARSGKKLIYVI